MFTASKQPTSRRLKILALAWDAYPPAALLVAAGVMAGGCSMKVGEFDMAGNEPEAAQLAAAEVQQPPAEYPVELDVVGNAAARAVALHGKDRLDLINLSGMTWQAGGRVWVNGRYACRLNDADPGVILKIEFAKLLDADGRAFPSDNREIMVERVELELAGELANVRYDLSY